MISLTASGPSCPLLSIILVVAMFSDSLKRVTISIKVGNVVKSVGFGTYKDIIKIKTETAKEIVKKRSKTLLGSGTMMIASIIKTKTTTVKSFDFLSGSNQVENLSKVASAKTILTIYLLVSIHQKTHLPFVETYLKTAISYKSPPSPTDNYL